MLGFIKGVISKVKCLVLRIPDRDELVKTFGDQWRGVSNPVKRINTNNFGLPYGWNLEDLRKALNDCDQIAKETPLVVEAVKEIPGFEEHQRETNEERPKFNCKCKDEEKK